jgi:hypothetical protein
MMRRRRNLIRVFLPFIEDALFISKYCWAPVLKQGPATYFTIGVKFCTLQTIISKKQEREDCGRMI